MDDKEFAEMWHKATDFEKELINMQANCNIEDKDIEIIKDVCGENLELLRLVHAILRPEINLLEDLKND